MILHRGKIRYLIREEEIIADIGGGQYIIYGTHDSPRRGVMKMKDELLNSEIDEYATPVDKMSLAVQCGVYGSRTRKPKEFE